METRTSPLTSTWTVRLFLMSLFQTQFAQHAGGKQEV